MPAWLSNPEEVNSELKGHMLVTGTHLLLLDVLKECATEF